MKIVFVMPDLHLGGAVTSTRLFAQILINAGMTIAVLPLGHRRETIWAHYAEFGIGLADYPDLARADLVIVFFWNTPEMHRFIRGHHPPMRVIVRPCIEGSLAPHVLTKEVAEFADHLWASTRSHLSFPEFDGVSSTHVHVGRDLSMFHRRSRPNRCNLVTGYMGTVDFVKLHTDFVAMSSAAATNMTFEVWGGGGAGKKIIADASKLGRSSDFKLMGPTDKPAEALGRLDIFGYPLCADSYSANDAVLQEAMATGLACAVLDHPGNRDLLRDGETALVAKNQHNYAEALRVLADDAELRERLGAQAAVAIRQLNSQRADDVLVASLQEVMSRPKRPRAGRTSETGAALFVASLGKFGTAFKRSLDAIRAESSDDLEATEAEIAGSSPGMCNPGAGGMFCYRAQFPDDPVLRYWSALVFEEGGRPLIALAELHAARRGGLNTDFVEARIERLGGPKTAAAARRAPPETSL